MECLTFRRAKLAVPHDASTELIEHVRGCAACAVFAREIDEFERRLHEAVHLAVPEGLAEQILVRHQRPGWASRMLEVMRNSFGLRQSALSGRRSAHVLVAAFVLSVIVAIALNLPSEHNEPADRFIAHVVAEPEVFRDTANFEPAKFDQAMARYGGQIHQPVGSVRHLGDCLIDGVVAQHILVQTPYGTATLILIPKRMSATSKPRTKDGYTVVVIALRNGSLGIVTDSPERTRKVEDLLKQRVTWDS
ncbi:MAG: DUF3379 family protein [Betaproteobacteria bacterium]|nr:DUF3379 family protein [Betaproteobacteria bacterium]